MRSKTFFQKFGGQNAFSLLEVLVALSILVTLTAGISNFWANSLASQKKLRVIATMHQLGYEIADKVQSSSNLYMSLAAGGSEEFASCLLGVGNLKSIDRFIAKYIVATNRI